MRKRSALEIDILAEYFRRAYRRSGWDIESAAAKTHRLVPLIAGNTAQPEAGRHSLAMQAIAEGIAKRQIKEAINV